MTSRRMRLAQSLFFTITLGLVPPSLHAQSAPDLGTLQSDMDTVKSDLAGIKKDLSEIRQLLMQRPAQAAPPAPAVSRVKVGDGPSLGKSDAPVTLVEFSDYQCPFCGRFFKDRKSVV